MNMCLRFQGPVLLMKNSNISRAFCYLLQSYEHCLLLMWFYYIILTLIIYTFEIASYPIESDHFNEILFLLNRTQISGTTRSRKYIIVKSSLQSYGILKTI